MDTKNVKLFRAQNRVIELKAFYKNVQKIIIFALILGTLNYFSNNFNYPWFLWIVGLMSIGLAIDAIRTFICPMLFKGWERRKIEAFLQNDTF